MTKNIVAVYIGRMTESPSPTYPKPRVSYWVTLKNSEGETITPHMFRVEYETKPGQALECANYEAENYADFFGVEITPYCEPGTELDPKRIRPIMYKTVDQLVALGYDRERCEIVDNERKAARKPRKKPE